MRSGSATEVPPNFWTTRPTAGHGTEPLAGGPTLPLKFVMTRLDNFVGKVMTVRGMLIGEGGREGINVMTTQPSTDACEAS